MFDYRENATASDWRYHVIQSLEIGIDLMEDGDKTFFDAIALFSDAYLSMHQRRNAEHPKPRNEDELEDIFFELHRSSAVIDSVIGSSCVVLMRWMEQIKQIAIADFILLETKFPFEPDLEPETAKEARYHRAIMQNFGSRVPGMDICGALAVWQIGNVFKHSGGASLHNQTKVIAKALGFSSQLLEVQEHESEEELRQMALREIAYTLNSESIERMALQLGCGPTSGLIPLYDHVESWQKAIAKRFIDEQAALRMIQ
jgi:hypothetical protein